MDTQAQLSSLMEAYGLRDVYAFGSRAKEVAAGLRGDPVMVEHPGSDLDIAVELVPGRELDAPERVRLSIALEDLFGVPRVDLVILSEASPVLAFEVVRGELLLTTDPLAQAWHELYVMRRTADLAHLRRDRIQQVLTEGGR